MTTNRKTVKWLYLTSVIATIAVFSSFSASAAQESNKVNQAQAQPLAFSGAAIQAISENHFRVKVSYSEAIKARCVGFAGKEPVAIDSVVVIPPYGVANMIINEDDQPIDSAQCWITSTREQDLNNDYIKHDLTEG
ncbi:hypothetical protein L2719_15595 [Shewanella schlegeliana]|uniref:Uncharacterized protein n=1 Tax=Shewanella schlegeliana TaxID=190308 RepID=A0ABS1T300_9GAMM|nr:hypothetical protein [Shewanella schlegeliana]MBL4915176.1 hypothetical protein [Shewanella schlegeliana]MCL1110956.1 hypothetical protein [Shewanella schlegeliana]GIU29448.1 hypothetical protein TUM4433_18780 [Shewanella schlegeliana]